MNSTKTTTFRFDERTMNLIDEIRKHTGASSNTEALRIALSITGRLTKETHENHSKITIRDEDGNEKELVIP